MRAVSLGLDLIFFVMHFCKKKIKASLFATWLVFVCLLVIVNVVVSTSAISQQLQVLVKDPLLCTNDTLCTLELS